MEPWKQEHVVRWRTCSNHLDFIRGSNLPIGEASGPVGCPSTPNVQPLSLSWISCILTKTIYETITDKLVALVSKAWRKWCRCLDFCLQQSWTPGRTPSKSSTWDGCWRREMKWLQCWRTWANAPLSIDSFMCTVTCALLYCSFTSQVFAQGPKGSKKKREK